MALNRAPKQWRLTTNETVNSFENWRQNLLYILSLDNNFAPFLAGAWQKKTAANPLRGCVDDGVNVPEASRKTAAQKNAQLDLMLGQIANYCAVISRNSIVKHSVSLDDIWQKIRQHYGFQNSGAHFLDLSLVQLQPSERPEDLFQRLGAFFEDNLLTVSGGVSHHSEPVVADEDLSPTLENTIVLLWLQLVHPGLPQLVKQKYGAELRNKTLASIKPEISQALPSLLDELRSIEDTKVLRTRAFGDRFGRPRPKPKSCILCKTAGRPHTSHNLLDCRHLPDQDKRLMSRSRLGDAQDSDHDEADDDISTPDQATSASDPLIDPPSALRVNVIQSPFLNTFYHNQPVQVILDTGATTNMIQASFAKVIKLPVTPASQLARQADGITPLDVVGEVHCRLTRGDRTFQLDALVVKQLDVNVLAGNPFLVVNDIATRPAKRQIVVQGSEVIYYGPQTPNRRTCPKAYLIRCPQTCTLLPGEALDLSIPESCESDATWALEPRLDAPSNQKLKLSSAWPAPQAITSVGHTLKLTNSTGLHTHLNDYLPEHKLTVYSAWYL